MVKKVKKALSNPVVTSNVKWAKNTAIGTAKGVTIAAAANIVGEGVRTGLRKGLKAKKHR